MLIEDPDDQFQKIVVYFLVMLDLWVLRSIKRKLPIFPLFVKMVVLDHDDILSVFDVEIFHRLG